MKEEPVFWLAGRPGKQKADVGETPPAQKLESAVFAACRDRGLEPEDFVAALGGYGSWLVHFTRADRRERIVWNGREQKLVLQRAIRSGGWEDLRDCAVGAADEGGFAKAIATLLGAESARPA
jgi:hypothetical protein